MACVFACCPSSIITTWSRLARAWTLCSSVVHETTTAPALDCFNQPTRWPAKGVIKDGQPPENRPRSAREAPCYRLHLLWEQVDRDRSTGVLAPSSPSSSGGMIALFGRASVELFIVLKSPYENCSLDSMRCQDRTESRKRAPTGRLQVAQVGLVRTRAV